MTNAASMENPFDSVNWQTVEPAGRSGREVFEVDGWHRVLIDDSKGAPNNQTPPTGFGLTFYLKCLEGPDAGKTIDHFMNAFHNSAQAQEIGQREVSAYCHATGVFKPSDKSASNLRNIPFWVRTQTVEEEYVKDGQTKTAKRTYVRDWDTNNGTKHGAGNANGAATPPAQTPPPATTQTQPASQPQTAPSNEAPAAGWGPPPPGAGEAPAQAAQGSWGQQAAPANGNAGAARQAPWGAS